MNILRNDPAVAERERGPPAGRPVRSPARSDASGARGARARACGRLPAQHDGVRQSRQSDVCTRIGSASALPGRCGLADRFVQLQEGNGILAHVFGNKDVSRQVAQNASDPDRHRSIDAEADVAARRGAGNGRALASVEFVPGTGAPGGDLMSMLTPVLDQNRDGSMVDDLLGLASRFMGRPGSA